MKNEYRRLGEFKDSEFAFQTSWSDYGEPASTVALEPRENPARCWHSAWKDRSRGGVRYGIFHYACSFEPAFTRNAPRYKTRRELSSVVVSGFRLGTKVDPSIRVIHICQAYTQQ